MSKPGILLRGTMCLWSSRDSTKLIPTTVFHCWGKYLHIYIMTMPSSNLSVYGTRKSMSQPYPGSPECSMQTKAHGLILCFALNSSYGS